ncbi:MAG TPA: glycosyltransferase domain-containing protein [Rudaea sp.]|nr:glycosyltransferase domain-containing protein [Rudaea sp.]
MQSARKPPLLARMRAAVDRVWLTPNPLFDARFYLACNPDVSTNGIDPWRHYLKYGAREGRDPNPVFDSDWYMSRQPDAAARNLNPLLHYWGSSASSGGEPNAFFDSSRIAVAAGGAANPLLYYLQHEDVRRRDPSDRFDSAWYARSNPDLDFGHFWPLADFLQYGAAEGRTPVPFRPPRRSSGKAGKPRIAVYTAIAGDYDALKIPSVVDADCSYFCFTDQDISWQDVWARRDLPWRHADPVRRSRYVKHHPHECFPDHEWSIWIDANVRLQCLPQELVPADEKWNMATWRHPVRDCAYAEAKECIAGKRDEAAIIESQMSRYRLAGYPERAGLTETCVMVRRHHDRALTRFAQSWWRELADGSRRDQLSFGFASRGADLGLTYLGPPGSDVRRDARFGYFKHKQRRPRWLTGPQTRRK